MIKSLLLREVSEIIVYYRNFIEYRVKVFFRCFFYTLMPDEYKDDFKDYPQYKSIEDFGKTVEGSKYYHSLYLKAVNHPIRRRILEILSKSEDLPKNELLNLLVNEKLIKDISTLDYNLDFLSKALCIETIEKENEIILRLTQAGKVIDYLE